MLLRAGAFIEWASQLAAKRVAVRAIKWFAAASAWCTWEAAGGFTCANQSDRYY